MVDDGEIAQQMSQPGSRNTLVGGQYIGIPMEVNAEVAFKFSVPVHRRVKVSSHLMNSNRQLFMLNLCQYLKYFNYKCLCIFMMLIMRYGVFSVALFGDSGYELRYSVNADQGSLASGI